MTEQQYQRIKAKIEREYPARRRLAGIAGIKRLDDETIGDLLLRIEVLHPDRLGEARAVVAEAWSHAS